jgi:hypothetical protein
VWELDGTKRVAGDGGADSVLRFRLERGGDGMKHCRKIKRATSARGEVPPGGGRKGGDNVLADVNFTGPKNKENQHYRFSC